MATIAGIVNSTLTQGWGVSTINYLKFGITLNKGYWHNGWDIAGPVGTPIYAWEDGTVSTHVQNGGWGNYVVFSARGWQVILAHLSKYGASGSVKKGQIIGYRGSSGNSTGPHTHLETHPPIQDMKNGALGAVDPQLYFNSINSGANMPYTEEQYQSLFKLADEYNGYAKDGLALRIIGRKLSPQEMRDYKTFTTAETVKRLRESQAHRNAVSQVYEVLLGRPATDEDYRIRYEQDLPEMWIDVARSQAHKEYVESLKKG